MNILDRFLLAGYSLVVALLSIAFLLFCTDFITIGHIEYWLVLARWKSEVIVSVCLILIISIRFFIACFKKSAAKELTIDLGSDGKTQITVKALTSFIEKSANQITALHSAKANITVLKNHQLKIVLSASILPDTDAVQLSSQVKEQVQKDILFTIGTEIKDLQIVFNHIGTKAEGQV